MISRLLFIPTLLISIFSLPLSSYLPSSLRGQPGHIVRLVALTPFAPGSPSPSRYRSFFPIYFLPLLQPSPSASPLLRPCCLSRCLPKVAWPNVAAPFVDITQSGCLPPCQTLLAVRRLCSSAITARCYYEAAYDSGAAYVGGCCGSLCTLLSLGTLLTTSGLVFPITSSLLFSLVPVCRLSLPLISRGGLCGTSLWHIVRPVLQCPSPPL